MSAHAFFWRCLPALVLIGFAGAFALRVDVESDAVLAVSDIVATIALLIVACLVGRPT